MNYRYAFVPLLTATLLSACGGGSSEGGNQSFNGMAERGEALIERLSSVADTPVNQMPRSGTANFTGYAAFAPSIYDEFEVISQADFTADFSKSTISGGLTNFRDYENTPLPGSVALQNGVIERNQFSGDLRGALTVQGRRQAVDGSIEGGFGGRGATALAGVIEGYVGNQYVVGIVGAER